MQANHSRVRPRKDKLKTMCTLDTYDVNPDLHPNKENRNRNSPHLLTLTKSSHARPTKRGRSHNKSLHSAFAHSRMRESTPKTKTKRLMSIAYNNDAVRMKTDYSECEQPAGFKKIVSELKKKLVFPVEENYRIQAFKILKMIHQTQKEQYYTVRVGTTNSKKYTLIRTKYPQICHQYELESSAYIEIASKMSHVQQKRLLLKVHRVWRDKKDWMVTLDNYMNPNWSNDKFYLFLNNFKNNCVLLKPLVKQLARTILAFSSAGLAHNNLALSSLYFPLVRGQLQPAPVKVGGLSHTITAKHKQGYLALPLLYRTPPEILNLILFQEHEPFDRDHLQHIPQLKEGWQTDVWALGILILQLLNGGPLAGQGSDCSRLIGLQRQLLIRYSYLLDKLDTQLHLVLSSMLSFNPAARPHPRDIMQVL